MTLRLRITSNVIERLNNVDCKNTTGGLFGIMYDSTLMVVGFNFEFNRNIGEGSKCYSQLKLNFATEVDLCGFVTFRDSLDEEEMGKTVLNILQDVEITDNPLVLSCQLGSPVLKTYFYISEKLEEIQYEVVNEIDLWKQFMHVRLQTRLPLTCELHADQIREGLQRLRKTVATGMVAFHFPKSGVYLMSSDTDTGLCGLTGEPSVGELWSSSFNQTEGSTGKKKKQAAKEIDVLRVGLLMKPTRDPNSEYTIKSSPVVKHTKKNFQLMKLSVCVDGLSMVPRNTKVLRLYGVLIDSVCRSLKLVERCILKQLETEGTFSVPETFHFLPQGLGHFVTFTYPRDKTDAQLLPLREVLHKELGLVMTLPCFRRANQFRFREDLPPNQPLINPHEGLSLSGVKGGEMSLVDGLYSYHHYQQDNIDDDGWGCAYRSLQTLVSWFRLQGYTDLPIPTHREVQQCLIRIGDKPQSFLGSRSWIGSTEVSFVLESMFGINSRIMTASSGTELSSRGSELANHFLTQGTPIMIGGGVLAHTILGIEYNKHSGDIKFLILDPHYTGGEDLGVIQSKGWCGWKGPNFWSKDAYYNLCLPQRPKCI